MNAKANSAMIDAFTRRTVRAWWADGLWDFAVAGYMLLIAVWIYFLVRLTFFPSWSWPWPFITPEVMNPLQLQVFVWMVGILPASALYLWAAFQAVRGLKSGWLAVRQGDVRHSFWLKVSSKTYAAYLLTFLAIFSLSVALFIGLAGGPRLFSSLVIAAPAAVLVVFGFTYALPRYRWAGLLGAVAALALEIMVTTPADFMTGPRGFLDVSPTVGNPALPALVWAVVFILSGWVGLSSVLRMPAREDSLRQGEPL